MSGRAVRRMGRPLGADARALLDLVRRQPLPLPRVAAELGLPYRTAWRTAESLLRGGHVTYGDKVPGLHDRPARQLIPVTREATPSTAPGLTELPRGFFTSSGT